MGSRRHRPIAITLDQRVEAFMDSVEKMLDSTVIAESAHYDRVENDLKELRRAWLAEQTARAMLDN